MEVLHIVCQNGDRTDCPDRMHRHSHVPSHGKNARSYEAADSLYRRLRLLPLSYDVADKSWRFRYLRSFRSVCSLRRSYNGNPAHRSYPRSATDCDGHRNLLPLSDQKDYPGYVPASPLLSSPKPPVPEGSDQCYTAGSPHRQIPALRRTGSSVLRWSGSLLLL